MEIVEIEEKKRNYDVEGISGTVTKYATREFEYPCVKIILNAEKPPAQCNIMLLKNMMIKPKRELNLSSRTITVYIGTDSSTKKVGRIYPIQLSSILDIFDDQTVVGFMSPEKKLEGSYVYAMAE